MSTEDVIVYTRDSSKPSVKFTKEFTVEGVMKHLGKIGFALVECGVDDSPKLDANTITTGLLSHNHYAVAPAPPAPNKDGSSSSGNVNPVPTGNEKPFDKARFLIEPINLPSLGENGTHIPMLGRASQVQQVKAYLQSLEDAAKAPVLVICTSRGMGKTFFLKKLCRMRCGPLLSQRRLGRIIALESALAISLLGDKNFEQFWSRAIVYHLCTFLDGCSVNIGSKVAPQWIVFSRFPAVDLVALARGDSAKYGDSANPFDAWAFHTARATAKVAISIMVNITNNLFDVVEPCMPVFLLDNAHTLAQQETEIWSLVGNGYHSYLSAILDYLLAAGKPPCIVAGTDDGNIKFISDRSNFIVVPLYLTTIGTQHWNRLGRAFTAHENHQGGKQVVWRDLNLTEETVEDESGDGMQVDEVDTSCEDDNNDLNLYNTLSVNSVDQNLLLSMLYQTCQIPRLMRFAFESWVKGKKASPETIPQYVTGHFEDTARLYYADVCTKILSYTARQFALMLIACSVHWPVTTYLLGPDTGIRDARREVFSVRELVNSAIIFPYRISPTSDACCYTMPTIFWDNVASSQADMRVALRWNEVKTELGELVPGLQWQHLCQGFSNWWAASTSLTKLGVLYEDLVIASLAAKYALWKDCNGPASNLVSLKEIYAIDNTAQARDLVASIKVDLSQGICYPDLHAVTATMGGLSPAVHVNRNFPTAYHDFILPSVPPTAAQCKHSLAAPAGTDIKPQLAGSDRLLWFYLGCDEDCTEPPKKYRIDDVQDKLDRHKLGFLSGAGCVGPFALDCLILMKKLITG